MKIAVCYSGCLRTFKKCYEKNHGVLSKHGDLDYYITTWENPCYTKVARYDDIHAINGDTIYDDLLNPDEKITDSYLRQFLPFKKIMIESMEVMDSIINSCSDMPWNIMSPSRLLCQYYMMSSCNSWMRDSGVDYNLVVKLRPDVIIKKFPNVENTDVIYLNSVVYKETKTDLLDMINEMVYVTNPENMNKICNIYRNFRNLWDVRVGYGERISRDNLENENLLDKCKLFDFEIEVIRENGNNELIK
jgi:hypothetical protein